MEGLITPAIDFVKNKPSQAFLIALLVLALLFVVRLGTKVAKIVVIGLLIVTLISASSFSYSGISGRLNKIVDLIMGTA